MHLASVRETRERAQRRGMCKAACDASLEMEMKWKTSLWGWSGLFLKNHPCWISHHPCSLVFPDCPIDVKVGENGAHKIKTHHVVFCASHFWKNKQASSKSAKKKKVLFIIEWEKVRV